MTDSVIEHHEQILSQARSKLGMTKTHLESIKKQVMDYRGNIRPGRSVLAAQKAVEIELLEKRVAELEAELNHANEDFPRREKARKEADKLEEEALEVDEEAHALVEQLKSVERKAQALRGKATHLRHTASRTARQLERDEKRQAADREKQKKDRVEFLQMETNLARRILTEAVEGHAHEDLIKSRTEDLKYLEEALAHAQS